MTRRNATSVVLAAGCALALAIPAARAQTADTQILATAPQANIGDHLDPAAVAQNIAQSREYMRQLQSNWGFREARIDRECGPITDAQLYQSCVASFDVYTPFVGDTLLAGNEWYPPNPQIATTQPHIVEQGLIGATAPPGGLVDHGWGADTMQPVGMTGYDAGMQGASVYGAPVAIPPHHAQTLAPVPGQLGPEPWYSSRTYPGQGSSVPPAGAAPTYPGPRISGPMSGNGAGGGGAGQ